jgi:hypothetical protein
MNLIYKTPFLQFRCGKFQKSENKSLGINSIDTLASAWTSAIYLQKVHDKSDTIFILKNIVQTSMRQDVFGTFAQMKHSLLRPSCLK